MKKIIAFILCGGLLVACSSTQGYDVKVSEGKTLISGSGIEITKQGYFEKLLDNYGANELLNEAIHIIAEKELTDQKAIDKAVSEKTKTYATYGGGSVEKYAKSAGYASEEEFKNSVILPMVKEELLRKKYINENLETLITDYQICSFKKITVDKESTALSLIKELTTKDAFDAKMKSDYSTNSEDAGVVTKHSTLDDNLKEKLGTLSKITKDGIYSEPIKLSDDNYVVVYLYGTDHKDTEAITKALDSNETIKKNIESIYLKKYNFKVNDSKIKKAIKAISENYIEE